PSRDRVKVNRARSSRGRDTDRSRACYGATVNSDAVGLCALCRHARRVESTRGSVFWQCGRAATDARFPRYPRLPVLRCDGFEARSAKPPSVDGQCAVAWSGGKDSCLARHRALLAGHRPTVLLNMCGPDGTVRFHGVDAALVDAQAAALGCQTLRVP